MRKLSAFAAVVVVVASSSSACGGSDSSNDGTLPPDGGADGVVDVGGGDAPQPTCAAKGDMPFHWVRRVATGANGGFVRNADGSILLFGQAASPTFGIDDPSPVHFTSKIGDQDYYVAKFTGEGALVWAKSGGGTDDDETVVATGAADGSVFIAGRFKGTATFGKGEPGETTLTASGPQGQFLAKLGPDGALAWVKAWSGTGTSTADPDAIFVESDGSLRVAGSLSGTMVLGKGETTETTLTSVFSDDWIARYDGASGALVWAKRMQALVTFPRFASDGAGNVLVSSTGGASAATTILAPGEPGEKQITASGPFYAKYDDSGEPVEVFTTSGLAGDNIVWSADGSWTIVGTLCPPTRSGPFTFGKGEPNETTFECGPPLTFVARYGADGKLAWAKKAGDPGPSHGIRLGVASDGSARVYGTYGASFEPSFGVGEPGAMKLPSNACVGTNCNTPYLAHFESTGTFTYAKRMSPDDPPVSGMDVTPDGVITISGTAQRALFGEGEPTQTTFMGLAGLPTTYIARYETCP